jgi:hypothetical protein
MESWVPKVPREAAAGRGLRVAGRIRPIRTVAFLLFFVLVVRVPAARVVEVPVMVRLAAAQEIADSLRAELSIAEEVRILPVVYHPFVFAVESDRIATAGGAEKRFRLSMEMGFLVWLDHVELRAALAHELGHVWIFTHHPFLQTERLANEIGQRVVARQDLERLYRKLWAYEGTPGVAMDLLLGPRDGEPAAPVLR